MGELFHNTAPGSQTNFNMLGNKYIYQLSHIPGPLLFLAARENIHI